jgi:hypothetical protein
MNMNAPQYYGFNNCGFMYNAHAEQSSPAFPAAPSPLDLYNLKTRNAPVQGIHHQQPHIQSDKRERRTQPNRSRTLYTKRLLVNARERERMKTLNKGFENLRNALPCYIADGHISKITTLRLAINYIKTLSAVLEDAEGQTLVEQQLLLEQTSCTTQADHLMNSDMNHSENTETSCVMSVYDSNGNEVQKNSNSQVSPTLSASQKTE